MGGLVHCGGAGRGGIMLPQDLDLLTKMAQGNWFRLVLLDQVALPGVVDRGLLDHPDGLVPPAGIVLLEALARALVYALVLVLQDPVHAGRQSTRNRSAQANKGPYKVGDHWARTGLAPGSHWARTCYAGIRTGCESNASKSCHGPHFH